MTKRETQKSNKLRGKAVLVPFCFFLPGAKNSNNNFSVSTIDFHKAKVLRFAARFKSRETITPQYFTLYPHKSVSTTGASSLYPEYSLCSAFHSTGTRSRQARMLHSLTIVAMVMPNARASLPASDEKILRKSKPFF